MHGGMGRGGLPRVAGVIVVALCVLAASCSSDDTSKDSASTSSTTAVVRKPKAEPAVLEGPITVGQLSGPADPRPVDLDAVGYVQDEFFASGTASAYATVGELSADGRWKAKATTAAPYKTRFLVRRPKDPARFS